MTKKQFLTILILLFIALIISTWQAIGQTKYELPCKKTVLQRSYSILLNQVGVRERTGHNDGYEVETYLKSVNLSKGNPYCAAGQYWCFQEAVKELNLHEIEIPIKKTGLANGIYNDAKKGKKVIYRAKKHDLIVWKLTKSYSGHIERIIKSGNKGWVWTVGFNTSNGLSGSQSNGNGVFKRQRNIYNPIGRLFVRGLIGFNERNQLKYN